MNDRKNIENKSASSQRKRIVLRVAFKLHTPRWWLRLRFAVKSSRFYSFIRRWLPSGTRNPALARFGWGALTAMMALALVIEVFDLGKARPDYRLSARAAQLIGAPSELLASSLKFDSQSGTYEYNKGYQPGIDVAGQSAQPKFTASFSMSPEKGVTVVDPVNEVAVSFKPQFGLAEPQQDQNRLIYPLKGRDAVKAYTLKSIGLKEDIILNSFQGDSIEFKYQLELADGTEARLESDGSLSIYGVSQTLLGNVSTATEEDAGLLQKARQNGEKNNLLFRFPAPFVAEFGKDRSDARARFILDGNELTIHATGLKDASYPLSIDPTVYIETAAKLMRGNNETNIDFDVDNELIQKGATTGARFDEWVSTMALNGARWGQGTAVAGGYIYSVGGTRSNLTSVAYSAVGNDTFVVPSGVTSITVKMWGGGGGGGGGGDDSGGGNGGGGGFAEATLSVTPSETLTVRVGGGGGGGVGRNSDSGNGGGGAGHSEIERSGTSLIIAAGGGGGGGGDEGSTTAGGAGGAGGGTSGDAGSASGGAGGGGGGTQASGGAAGNGANNDGTAGSSETGGLGADGSSSTSGSDGGANNGGTATGGDGGLGSVTNDYAGGGGGGSGRFGGGGGAGSSGASSSAGGGGGGSSYTTGTGTTNTAGSGIGPGNPNDPDRSSAGEGGSGGAIISAGTAGTGGRIIVSYAPSGSSANETRPELYWAHFNTSSKIIESPNPGGGACTNWCTDGAYNLPVSLTGLSLVAYNGFLYAIGGSDDNGDPQTSVYIAKLGANGEPQLWHPSGGTPTYWHSDTTLSNARSYFGAVAYNNRMYILGGLTTSNTVLSTNTVQYANINPMGTLDSWTATGMTALPSNRYGHTAHVYNDYIYLVGGSSTFAGAPVDTVHFIKLSTDGTMLGSWQTAANSFTTGRMTWGGSFSAIWGGYLYLAGGCSALNGSGYCTTIQDDVQLASINADGSLGSWGSIIGIANQHIGYSLVGWRNTLYRIGGCTAQSASTGDCTAVLDSSDYGEINPTGEASTVATSEESGTAPCSGGSPYNCDLPSSVGNMLNATAIMNGHLYIMGGCTNNACTTYSTGVTYQAIASDGSLQRPASCTGTYSDSYCVSSSSLPQTVNAAGVTVFNGRIYIVGGFPTVSDIFYASVNGDGSLGAWHSNDAVTGSTTAADAVSYTFAYARANPASAGTNPGNLFIFGGCSGTISGIGCSSYSEAVYKCNITTSGSVTSCSTTNQLQIGTPTGASGTGLGAFAGAVYANYIYLMGGLAPGITDLTVVRYAEFDNNNNVVAVSGSAWVEGGEEMNTGRRRGSGFGYNGYLYVLGGYDGADAIADIEFAKLNVSDGSWEFFDISDVTIQKRWALTTVVSNSYAYVVGGCIAGAAPSSCSSRTSTIQTFQIYNNESGTPANYSAGANLFATDRLGTSAAILDGYIYIAGGCTAVTSGECTTATDNVQYATLDSYGAIGSWSNTTDSTLPQARAFGQLEAAGGTLYYIGGQSSTATDERPEVYYGTPSSGDVSAWTAVSSSNDLPDGRTQHSAAVWNNRIYVVGGIAETGGAASNVVYASPDLSGGGAIGSAWTATGMTAFNIARSGHTTITYANNLYIFGGYDGSNYLSDSQFTQINPDGTLDAWTYTTSLPTPLRQADGFAVNGYMYLFGGRTDDNTCTPKTLVAPISANTVVDPNDLDDSNFPTGVGEWFETNRRYTGDRYGGAAVYSQGKAYVLGGACDAFPSVASITVETFPSDGDDTHNVDMPATVDAGDLLLAFFTNDGSATTTATGWTSIATQARGTAVRGTVFAKVAIGNEDGTQVDFDTGASNEQASAQVYRIPAAEWSGTLAGVEAAAVDPGGTTNAPNPPSLNPGGWGTENTLWFVYAAGSSWTLADNYPTSYSAEAHTISNTGTAGTSASSARFKSASASQDPGAFAMSTTSDGVAFTVAVRPAGGMGLAFTGGDRVTQTALLSQPQVAKYSRLIDTDTDVFPNAWLMNGVDHSIGSRWQARYRSMHDLDGTGFVNPNEDCGTSASMPTMTTWGQDTNFGDVTLGRVEVYTPLNSSGGNINCARYYYFFISIDSSQTFGYPEDVTRGPTITDISLFFTSDPSKRLRHGKTFTGGELQPLDTPCRQSNPDPNADNCPLP